MLDEHLGYLADHVRIAAFNSAIAQVLQSNDRVVDLGCGSGVLGLLCLQAGASRIYAIDSTAMIEVARGTLSRAGFEDRAEFIHGHSHRVNVPDRVDLIICDQVGFFGFGYGIVGTIQDARHRFLVPGGQVLPRLIRLEIAAVESIATRERKVDRWHAEAVPPEFHWLHHHAANTKHAVDLEPDAILGPPRPLGEIDLRSDNPDFFRWTATLHVERDGILHGLAGWFDCELADGITITNSPLEERAIDRSQAFFPLEEAVQVHAGDEIQATVMARPGDNLIAWVVELPAAGRRFSHSTWHGMPLSAEDLMRARPHRVPQLSREGRAHSTVLAYCDGQRTAREVEQLVLTEHPDLLPSAEEIRRFVAQVLSRDTE